MREFVAMALVGLVVVNAVYFLGAPPLVAVVVAFLAAVTVSAVLGRRARAGEGD
ncbi:hypothetical protein ABT186_01900 [Streptomyces sp. NPDC001634]|uniref:hypothetical protein n=1 Tax=Streptomyces sp. NPDC001634 TaxID=3154390 RepID=UPI00331FF26E